MRKATLGATALALVAAVVAVAPPAANADTGNGAGAAVNAPGDGLRPVPPGEAVAGRKPGQNVPHKLSARDASLMQRQQTLLPTAQDFAAQARSASSDIAGVQLDIEGGAVHVYRTNPGQALRLATGAAVPSGVKVIVHPAKYSRTAMNQAMAVVTRDAQLLGEQQVSVQAVGPTVDGSGITVSVVAADAALASSAETALKSRYGAVISRVTATATRPSDDGLYFAGWRFNDFSPWYGGDRIASSVGGCSTGFYAVLSGAPVMLTASHCGGVGTSFYNGPRTDGTYSFMGNSVYSNTATDVGAIGVAGALSTINVGPAENSSLLYVPAWQSPIVGQYLCQSGSYTGERCGLYVVDTGQSVCLSWILWFCSSWQGPLADVVTIYGSGSYAAGHGDSGGPVYAYNGSQGIATGLVHGQLTPNAQAAYPAYFPDTLLCPAPEGWSNRCSSGFSFAHMPGY